MFVDIEKFEGALAIENLLTPYKKGRLAPDKKTRLPKEKITRDVCFEVLKSTNYARNIKDMLQCIAELPQSEQAQFKDVVLACFANREQPEEIFKIAEKLAQTSGYLPQLLNEPDNVYDGDYLYSANYLKEVVSTKDETMKPEWQKSAKLVFCGENALVENQAQLPEELAFFQTATAKIALSDAKNVKNLYFREIKQNASMDGVQNLRANLIFDNVFHAEVKDIDFSQCPEVKFLNVNELNMQNAQGLPNVLDVSSVEAFSANQCDFQTVRQFVTNPNLQQFAVTQTVNLPDNIKIQNAKGADFSNSSWQNAENLTVHNVEQVQFAKTSRLPKNMELRKVKQAEFVGADFEGVEGVVCNQTAVVNFADAKNLPPQIGLEDCQNVSFKNCDLSQVKNLDLSDVRQSLDFEGARGLPKVLKHSALDKISCYHADMRGVEKVCVRGIDNVSLDNATNLSAEIELSDCSIANIRGVDLSNIKSLKFHNIIQTIDMGGSRNFPKNYSFSNVERLDLQYAKFGDMQSLKVKKIKEVAFDNASQTPKMIVLQGVDKVSSQGCDFSQTDTLICRNVDWVNMTGTQRLPKKIVFEDCDVVNLSRTNGIGAEEIVFRNVRQVYYNPAYSLPQKVDFSGVKKLDLRVNKDNLKEGQEFIFRDYSQMRFGGCYLDEGNTGVKLKFLDKEKTNIWTRLGLNKLKADVR